MLRWYSTILGPVYGKEMVEMSRRKRYYFNRVLYGAALFATLFIVWENYDYRLYRSGESKIDVLADMAEETIYSIIALQYLAVFMFVPIFVCGVIAAEREDRSLELLFTTDLRDREIVLGKLASRLTLVLLLFFISLPIMFIVRLFGGVDAATILRTQAATLLAITYAGAHAIYFSSVSKWTIAALVRTYWWMALWMLALPVILYLTLSIFEGGRPQRLEWIFASNFYCNPLFQMSVAVKPFVYDQWASSLSRFGWLGKWFFPLSFAIPSAWSAFLIWRAVARLRHEPRKLTAILRSVYVFGALLRPIGGLRAKLDACRRRRAEKLFRRFEVQNPLWLRARLAAVFDRGGHVQRIQIGCWVLVGLFILLILIVDGDELLEGHPAILFLVFIWIGVALLTVIVAAISVVGDRRRGFLELTLATPIEPRTFVHGTFLAVGEHLKVVYLLPWVVGMFFFTFNKLLVREVETAWERLPPWIETLNDVAWMATSLVEAIAPWFAPASTLVTATLFCATIIAVGAMGSLVSRSIPHAIVMTFVYVLVVTAGTPWLIVLFEEDSGPVLWLLSAAFCFVTWHWCKHRLTATSVGCRFLAVHLVFCCITTCWTFNGRDDEFPIVMTNAAYLTIAPLELLLRFYARWYDGAGHWFIAVACYWIALLATLWWARRWTIRNLDRLAGRVVQLPGAPVATSNPAPFRDQS